jgi:thymidine phosphorylase
MDKPEKYLKAAPFIKEFYPAQKGRVSAIDARAIGIGIVELGGGRAKPSDVIDHAVGITAVAQIGEEVGAGAKPLAVIHAKDEAGFRHMSAVLQSAMTVAEKANVSTELVKARLTA